MNTILLIICIAAVSLTLWFKSPASSEDISNLIVRTNNSSSGEVKQKLVYFLKETPNPTRQQLADFEDEVDQMLVVDLSRQVTGDHSLQAKLLYAKPQPESPPSDHFLERMAIWLFCVVVGFFASARIYQEFRNRKEN